MLRRTLWRIEHPEPSQAPRRRRLRKGRLTAMLASVMTITPLVIVATHTEPVQAATASTFTPVADTFVDSTYPNTNFGTRVVLRADASPVQHSYLRFSVANLPAAVTQATLSVYANDSNAAGFKVAGVANNTWGETTMTYNTAPPIGSVVSSSGSVTAGHWYSVDVTSLVPGNGLVSMALLSTSSSSTRYASRESGSTTAPKLVVQTSSTTTTTAASSSSTTTTAPSPTTTTTKPSTTTTTAPSTTTTTIASTNGMPIKNVWVMMMENTAWHEVSTDSNFNYVQTQLMPNGAYANNYISAPSNEAKHPSLPNYIRLEAGTNLNITSGSCLPSSCPGNTTNHLSTLFKNHNVTWKTYHERLPGNGTECPVNIDNVTGYSEDHNAPLYFPDFTNDTNYCMTHERPYTELATDLSAGTAPQFSFIVPDDYHTGEKFEPGYSGTDPRHKYLQQDNWLSTEIPKIMASAQYKAGGAILILWDETAFGNSTDPNPTNDPHSGCILMSPWAKKHYGSSVAFTHVSTVRSIQEIFGATSPWVGLAGTSNDLQDLFSTTI